MPTKSKYAETAYRAMPKGIDILNVIRANASSAYQERVPVATQENIKEVGNPILNYQAVANEFLSSLVNRIGMVLITNKMYNNPLKEFKKGMMSLGETVEEIFVNIIKAEPYYEVDTQGRTDCQDAFERRLPDVKAVFHTRNRQDKYPTTISNDDLRAAFLSYEGVEELVTKIIEAVYTSDEYDEFLLMKNIFFEAGQRGALKAIAIPDPTTQDSAKQAITTLRGTSRMLTFMSNQYNLMGVTTHTPISDQVIFILASFEAVVDVEVLASAFNMDKAEFIGRRVVVDDFGGLEQEGVVAILADRDWFMVFDNYVSMTEVYNPARLYWNYFLHHWETLSYSPFKNAIAFTTQAPTVTAVTVTPGTATLPQATGGTVTFTANVTGTGLFDPNVTWTASAGTIDSQGKFIMPGGTTTTSVTITATSKGDTTKTATATVTLTPAGRVTGLAIDPQTATISKTSGGTQQFTSSISVTGSATKEVQWLCHTATNSTAEISNTGLLTVPPNDPSDQISVVCVSKYDSSVSASATVTLS